MQHMCRRVGDEHGNSGDGYGGGGYAGGAGYGGGGCAGGDQVGGSGWRAGWWSVDGMQHAWMVTPPPVHPSAS